MSNSNKQAAEKAAKEAAEKAAQEAAAQAARDGESETAVVSTVVKMLAPEGGTGISIDGVSYEVDEKGIVEIPSHLVGNALAHGFEPAKPATK